MDRRLLDYLPPVLRNVPEFKALMAAEQPELEALWQGVEDAFADQFIDDATKNGISRWEGILSIIPKGTDSLDTRRFRIKTRLNEQLPFTLPVLKQKLAHLCGNDGYAVEMDKGGYILNVSLYFDGGSRNNEIWDMLGRIVPANIIFRLISVVQAPPLTLPLRAGGAITARIISATLPPLSLQERTESA